MPEIELMTAQKFLCKFKRAYKRNNQLWEKGNAAIDKWGD